MANPKHINSNGGFMKENTRRVVRDGKTFEVRWDYMSDPIDPREWVETDSGQMICWHSRYKLGDKHNYKYPDDFREWLKETYPNQDDYLLFDIYAYEHSGISLSLERSGQYADRFDSYQAGYFLFTKEEGLKLFPNSTNWKVDCTKLANGQIKEYNKYLNNDILECGIFDVKVNHLYVANEKGYEFLRSEEVFEYLDGAGEFYSEEEMDSWIESAINYELEQMRKKTSSDDK
jgi:hypothetical protein